MDKWEDLFFNVRRRIGRLGKETPYGSLRGGIAYKKCDEEGISEQRVNMDFPIEMPQIFFPVERRPRQEWPWCKGFIVKGIFYFGQVVGEFDGEGGDFFDLPPSSQRSRAPMA